MVAVSSTSSALPQASSSSGSNSAKITALEKQIAAKEGEVKEIKDAVKSAAANAELTAMRAELADLKGANKTSESKPREASQTETPSRQAEFDSEDAASASATSVWV